MQLRPPAPSPTCRSILASSEGQGTRRAGPAPRNGFTLIELLVVIAIIGILATVGLPAIRGMTKSNIVVAANRQLLDDIAFARQRSIADHTTVYMAFIPPDICSQAATEFPLPANTVVRGMITNLYRGQCTTYALLELRSVGDQPGLPTAHYLTAWRTLPTGSYIATNKLVFPAQLTGMAANYAPPFARDISFPFPVATNLPPSAGAYRLPYIAFNYLGQLVDSSGQIMNSANREFIPIARGSIFYSDDGSGTGGLFADILETPSGNAYYTSYNSQQALNNQPLLPPDNNATYNQVHIDPLTGRARIEHQEIQ